MFRRLSTFDVRPSTKSYSKPGLQLVAETADFAVDSLLFQRPFRRAEDEADRRLDPALRDSSSLVTVHDADRLEVRELRGADHALDLVPARRLLLGEGQVRFDRRVRRIGLEARRAGKRHGLDPQLAGEDIFGELALLPFCVCDESAAPENRAVRGL